MHRCFGEEGWACSEAGDYGSGWGDEAVTSLAGGYPSAWSVLGGSTQEAPSDDWSTPAPSVTSWYESPLQPWGRRRAEEYYGQPAGLHLPSPPDWPSSWDPPGNEFNLLGRHDRVKPVPDWMTSGYDDWSTPEPSATPWYESPWQREAPPLQRWGQRREEEYYGQPARLHLPSPPDWPSSWDPPGNEFNLLGRHEQVKPVPDWMTSGYSDNLLPGHGRSNRYDTHPGEGWLSDHSGPFQVGDQSDFRLRSRSEKEFNRMLDHLSRNGETSDRGSEWQLNSHSWEELSGHPAGGNDLKYYTEANVPEPEKGISDWLGSLMDSECLQRAMSNYPDDMDAILYDLSSLSSASVFLQSANQHKIYDGDYPLTKGKGRSGDLTSWSRHLGGKLDYALGLGRPSHDGDTSYGGPNRKVGAAVGRIDPGNIGSLAALLVPAAYAWGTHAAAANYYFDCVNSK